MLEPLRDIFRVDVVRAAPKRFRLLHLFSAVAILLLVVEVVSGVLLLAYYRPTAPEAFRSVGIIVDEVSLGWLVRSLHAWSANFLILFTVLHLARVYFVRAYAQPRQLTWITGILLLFVFFAFALTGTLLPWDQYAYWSTEVMRQTVAGIPLVGSFLLSLLWGGWELGEEGLLRFYVLHVGVLPWIAALLLWLHMLLVWHLGLTEPVRFNRGPQRQAPPFFPDFAVNLLIAVLLLSGVLISVATFLPPPLGEQADALAPLSAVRPPWYFSPLHELLRRLPAGSAALVVVFGSLALLLVAVADGQASQPRWREVLRWGLGIAAIVGCVYLGLRGYLG